MDVWSLSEQIKRVRVDIDSIERRMKNIEEYLIGLSSKLESINKASNEAVSNKKDKASSVRAKRSSTKKG